MDRKIFRAMLRGRLHMVMGMMVIGASFAYAQSIYYYPLVANGSFVSGSFRTTLSIINTGTIETTVHIRLTNSNGGPLIMPFPKLGISSEFTLALPPGSSRSYRSDGSGDLTAGAATISATNPISATIFFSQWDASGNLLTEAILPNAGLISLSTLSVEINRLVTTGIAIFNPALERASIKFYLMDRDGMLQGLASFSLTVLGQRSVFISELFPEFGDFQGYLWIVSDVPLATTGLRTYNTAGPLIAILPVSGGD